MSNEQLVNIQTRFLLIALGWGILNTGGIPSLFAGNYEWPAEQYLGITSSFCEFRPNHFHGGIDLRTGYGMPVIAIDDGYVSRVNVSGTGYGKALYITLSDGNIAVYAHLQKFIPEIEAAIKRQQRKDDRYRVDFSLSAADIPVKRGQVVAYSGDTGAGPAHLHFEIRDRNNQPMNPLTHGFAVTDNRNPGLFHVRFEPMDIESYVSPEKPVALTYKASDRAYTTQTPIQLSGTIGVSVRAHDYITMTTNQMSPYSLEMYCDQVLYHQVEYEKYNYDLTYQSDLEFDLRMSQEKGQSFHHLYLEPNNRLIFYPQRHAMGKAQYSAQDRPLESNDGLIQTYNLSPGLHQIKIIARDVAGNEAVALVPFTVASWPAVTDARLFVNDQRWHVDFGFPLPSSQIQVLQKSSPKTDWRQISGYQWEISTQRLVFSPPISAQSDPFYVQINGIDAFGAVAPLLTDLADDREPIIHSLRDSDVQLNTSMGRNYLEIDVQTNPGIFVKPITIVKAGNGLWRDISLRMIDIGHYQARYQWPDDGPGLLLIESYLTSANGYQVSDADQQWMGRVQAQLAQAVRFSAESGEKGDELPIWFYFPQGSAREDFMVSIRSIEEPAETKMTLCSDVYEIGPAYVLLDNKASLLLEVDDALLNQSRMAIFRLHNGYWRYESRQRQNNVFKSEIRKLGTFAVYRDTAPPNIRALLPANKKTLKTPRPQLKAWVYDTGSGIDQDDVVMRLDGQKVYAEFDGERNFIFYDPDQDLERGNHTVTLTVIDRVGNQTVVSNQFTIK